MKLSIDKQTLDIDNITVNYHNNQLLAHGVIKAIKVYIKEKPKTATNKPYAISLLEKKLENIKEEIKQKKKQEASDFNKKIAGSAIKSLAKNFLSGLLTGKSVKSVDITRNIISSIALSFLQPYYKNMDNEPVPRNNSSTYSNEKISLHIDIINQVSLIELKTQQVLLNDKDYGRMNIESHINNGKIDLSLQTTSKYLKSTTNIQGILKKNYIKAKLKNTITINQPKHFIPKIDLLNTKQTKIPYIVIKMDGYTNGGSLQSIIRALHANFNCQLGSSALIVLNINASSNKALQNVLKNLSDIKINRLKLSSEVKKGVAEIKGALLTDVANINIQPQSFFDINSGLFDIWIKTVVTKNLDNQPVLARVLLPNLKQNMLIGISKKDIEPLVEHFSSLKSILELLS